MSFMQNLNTVSDNNPAEKVDWQKEAVLENDIGFSNIASAATQAKSILVTCATGLEAARQIRKLIDKTQANIYCLVEAENPIIGKKIIRDNLKAHSLWKSSDEARLLPVMGRLNAPLLGVPQKRFDFLGKHIDCIYHNGLESGSQNKLKSANVEGTKTLLRLAGLHKMKPFHFVSAFQGLPADASGLTSETNLSHWAAEKLLLQAQSRGLPLTINHVEEFKSAETATQMSASSL